MMNIFAVKEIVDFVPVMDCDLAGDADAGIPPPARIKVVGVGGGGSNAVNRMIENGLSGVQFITVNTDAQDLYRKSRAETKLQIGNHLTGGRGAGGKPIVGENAAKEDQEEITAMMRGADMVFVTAGMGGGTGTGAAPVVAKIARDQGALTVAVVTSPFDFEGEAKRKLAEDGIKKLRDSVDSLVVIPNQRLFDIAERKTTVTGAYKMADDVLRQGVQGITDLITKTGLINTDFADVEATMKGQGDALMGIGMSKGDTRAEEAARQAIDNPLLEDTSIEGATRLLVNISGSEDTSIIEVNEVMNLIKAKADPDVEIIHGVIIDPDLGDYLKVTVLATGFREKSGMASGREYASRKSGTSQGEIITADRFNEMRGLAKGGRTGDGYIGTLRSRELPDNLDVPTYVRKKSAAGGMEA